MKRNTLLIVPLRTSNFGTIKTSRNTDLDTSHAAFDCSCNSFFKGSSPRDTFLKLLSNTLSNELSIEYAQIAAKAEDLFKNADRYNAFTGVMGQPSCKKWWKGECN